MCLIIAFIIANAIFDLLPISSGLVIGAGVLACVGLGYLFPDKDNAKSRNTDQSLLLALLAVISVLGSSK